ncbi:MAG: HYC_CC_PP family protein [Flavobacterium sp.]
MKLRSYISTLLSIFILASNIGLALNVHYCHGQVSDISLAYRTEECAKIHAKKKDACCAVKADEHKGCCKNDVVKLQDKSDNIIVKSIQLDFAPMAEMAVWKPAVFSFEAPAVKADAPSFYCESHAPPLYKLYSQYIFYA